MNVGALFMMCYHLSGEEMYKELVIRIEVPRGSFIKRELHDGSRVSFVSPFPCPFNYGYILDSCGDDGDPEDAIFFGGACAVGDEVVGRAIGRVLFLDKGERDNKTIISDVPLSRGQKWALSTFFTLYAIGKRALSILTLKWGVKSRFEGIEIY